MTKKVLVVDYGVGNLFSVTKALEVCGASVTVSEDPQALANADRVLIPGVGAFADGMEQLSSRGLVEPIRRFADSGRPLMGICLGMQLLFSRSEEFGSTEGLDLIAGTVKAIPNETASGGWRKTPHIGWNELLPAPGRTTWDDTLFAGLPLKSAAYFVHSFSAIPADPAVRLADCDHDGYAISAAVQDKSICGCQFHPEKSGETGLHIVRNFLQL